MTSNSPIDVNSDDDPIVATYNVFMQSKIPDARTLLVLQQPSRFLQHEQPLPAANLRLKRKAGMVEVDVPVDLNRGYDKQKGQNWGTSLQRSVAAKNGGSHGLAGGFSLGAPPSRVRKQEEKEDALLDWNEAVRTEKVLRLATEGGMAPNSDESRYMVAIFKDGNLHLTPAAAVINLRSQFHHIDAFAESERRREAAAAAAAAAEKPSGPAAGRAIHMTIKNSSDEVTTETMADRLKTIQGERWSNLGYVDENNEQAWVSFDENLVMRVEAGANDKGKGIATSEEEDLEEKAKRLLIRDEEGEGYLYTISGKEKRGEAREAEVEVREVKVKPDPARKSRWTGKEKK